MKYKKFKQILNLQKDFTKKRHTLYTIGIDLMEFQEDIEKAIGLLWEEVLTKEGADWLNWFCYEKAYFYELKEDIKAWDENGVEIIKDLKGLYDYLVENKYFKI